jgi:rsbT co-antagonist protein RsbR
MSESLETSEIDALRRRVAALEDELHRSEERFRLLTTRTPDGIYHFNADGSLLFGNERFCEILGLLPEETTMSRWGSLIAPEDEARIVPTFQQGLDGERPFFDEEYRIVRRDGTTRWIRAVTAFVFDEHGALVSYLGSVTDTTERNEAEEALRKSEARARLLSQRLPVGVFERRVVQGRPTFTFINDRWCELLGITREQVSSEVVWGLLHPDDLKHASEAWRSSIAAQVPLETEERFVRPDGELRWLRIVAEPVFDENGELISYLGALIDITDRKKLEELLGETMAQKEIIDAQRARLAEVSTPLIPITDEIMVMPLVGEVDPERAAQVLETLLAGVSRAGARVAILDVTGVVAMNAEVAEALVRAAQAVKLLGAQAVLSGIRSEVAQTLVELGADVGAMATFSSLKAAIAHGMRAVRAGR